MNFNPEKPISIQFKKSEQYKTVAATGVCGGVNPAGEIVAQFFVEQVKLPKNLTLRVDPTSGKIVEAVPDIEDNEYVRELQVAVVLRPDIAKSVGEWLIREANKTIAGPNQQTSQAPPG